MATGGAGGDEDVATPAQGGFAPGDGGPELPAQGGAAGGNDVGCNVELEDRTPTVADCVPTMCSGEIVDTLEWQGANDSNAIIVDAAVRADGSLALSGYLSNGTIDLGGNSEPVGVPSNETAFVAMRGTEGTMQWARGLTSTEQVGALGVARDTMGNVFVTGYFSGSLDLGDGAGPVIAKGYDAFQAAYDGSGTLVWGKVLSDALPADGCGVPTCGATQMGRAVAGVGDGSSIFVGGFSGSIDFRGATHYDDSGDAWAPSTAFVVRRSPTGERLWDSVFASNAGATGLQKTWIAQVSLDDECNTWVYGAFAGVLELAGKTFATDTSDLGGDVFMAKLDTAGHVLDAWAFGGESGDFATGFARDAQGNFAFAADTESSNFGIGELAPGDGTDGMVAYVFSDGTPRWAARLAGAGNQEVLDVAFDPFGNLLVTGLCKDSFVIESTTQAETTAIDCSPEFDGADAYVAKFAPQGAVVWAKAFADQQEARTVGTDAAANVYILGKTDEPTGLPSSSDAFLLELAP